MPNLFSPLLKIAKALAVTIIFIAVIIAIPFFIKAPTPTTTTWGVNFSQEQATYLGLDWKQNYLAILDDLKVKHLKLFTRWGSIESEKGQYDFADIDWQLNEVAKRNGDVIYVVGMKSGRWPECHLPSWANALSKEDQQQEILNYLEATINHQKDKPVISAWQAENEPLFNFGICPWYDKQFLKKEVALIKQLDPTRPVIVSDTGEQSLWIEAAQIGDIVGTTMYRKAWAHITDRYGFYVTMPIAPSTYWLKSQLIQSLFNKKVINIELQAEPWTPNNFHDTPLAEQATTMNPEYLASTIAYAKKSGFDTFYFWGAEWWYWMKEKNQDPRTWQLIQQFLTSETASSL